MPPWNTQQTEYCTTVLKYTGGWTSDSAFCVPGAVSFWQTCLFIGLAFWGFFTTIQLFSAFDIQHSHGQALGRTMTHLVRQVILLLLACASFFLLMLVHQLVYLICNSLVGKELPPWRVDDLWLGDGGQNVLMALRIQLDAPYANNPLLDLCNMFSGGNCGFGQPQIGGNTFFQIAQGIGFLAGMMLQSTGTIRFVMMLVLLGAAPLAIMTAGFSHLRERVFRFWLTKWLELEGLAIVTALGLAAFQAVLCGGATNCAQYTQVHVVIAGQDIPVTPGKPLLIPENDQTIWSHDFPKYKVSLVFPKGMITLQIPEDVTTLTTVNLGQTQVNDPYFKISPAIFGNSIFDIPVSAPGQLLNAIETAAGNVPLIGIPLKNLVQATLGAVQFAITIGGDVVTATLGTLGALQIEPPAPPSSFGKDNQTQFVFLLLGFAVIVCGLQIGYVWNFIGNFLTLGTNMYRADYNRDVATIKAIANVVGMAGDLIGKVLTVAGMATGQPELMAAGQIVSSVSDAPDKLMSAIPQANGYGGGTMAALPPSGSSGFSGGSSPGSSDMPASVTPEETGTGTPLLIAGNPSGGGGSSGSRGPSGGGFTAYGSPRNGGWSGSLNNFQHNQVHTRYDDYGQEHQVILNPSPPTGPVVDSTAERGPVIGGWTE